MSQPQKGHDAGGVRYFLDGKPIHAGVGLELRLPPNAHGETTWAAVRWEMTWLDGSTDVPTLHLYIGTAWDRRFTVTPTAAVAASRDAHGRGAWIVYDTRRERPATLTERSAPDADYPKGRAVYGDYLGDVDAWSSREAAERACASLQATMEGSPTVVIKLAPDARVDLRWPRSDRATSKENP